MVIRTRLGVAPQVLLLGLGGLLRLAGLTRLLPLGLRRSRRGRRRLGPGGRARRSRRGRRHLHLADVTVPRTLPQQPVLTRLERTRVAGPLLLRLLLLGLRRSRSGSRVGLGGRARRSRRGRRRLGRVGRLDGGLDPGADDERARVGLLHPAAGPHALARVLAHQHAAAVHTEPTLGEHALLVGLTAAEVLHRVIRQAWTLVAVRRGAQDGLDGLHERPPVLPQLAEDLVQHGNPLTLDDVGRDGDGKLIEHLLSGITVPRGLESSTEPNHDLLGGSETHPTLRIGALDTRQSDEGRTDRPETTLVLVGSHGGADGDRDPVATRLLREANLVARLIHRHLTRLVRERLSEHLGRADDDGVALDVLLLGELVGALLSRPTISNHPLEVEGTLLRGQELRARRSLEAEEGLRDELLDLLSGSLQDVPEVRGGPDEPVRELDTDQVAEPLLVGTIGEEADIPVSLEARVAIERCHDVFSV